MGKEIRRRTSLIITFSLSAYLSNQDFLATLWLSLLRTSFDFSSFPRHGGCGKRKR